MAVIAIKSRVHKYRVVHKALDCFLDNLSIEGERHVDCLTTPGVTYDVTSVCRSIEACLTHANGYGEIDAEYKFIHSSSAKEALYIAAIIAFKMELRHPVVARVMYSIFIRERSFESLFFDVSVLKMHSSSWHKYFNYKAMSGCPISPHVKYVNDAESLRLMEYFLDYATRTRLVFDERPPARLWYSEKRRGRPCVDHALEVHTPMSLPAIGTVIRLGNADVLKMLLRYGAGVDFSHEGDDGFVASIYLVTCFFKNYLRDRQGFLRDIPTHDMDCLGVLLRVVRFIDLRDWLKHCQLDDADTQLFVSHMTYEVIPRSRGGREPPELKHLTRCTIRDVLRECWQLPHGIYKLGLPKRLEEYLDIELF